MIDINKMRRLAQAATPGPWVAAGPSFGESLPKYLNEVAVDREGDEDDGYSICNAPIGLNEECSDDMAFIAEANPLTIEALLDRLEAAEKSRDDLLACLGEWLDKTKWVQQGVNEGTISAKYLGLHRADVMSSLLGEAEKERAALRAKIKAMEQQEPVAWCATDETGIEALGMNQSRRFDAALYLAPGAQPAQKAVAYLDLGVGGYMDIGTDLTDEALAAIPKGRHMLGIVGTYGVEGYSPAQPAPSIPEGWKPIPEKHPTFDLVDLKLADGSVLCGCVPQGDGDYWWEGPSGEVFIDPRYAPVTHWRLATAPEAKP